MGTFGRPTLSFSLFECVLAYLLYLRGYFRNMFIRCYATLYMHVTLEPKSMEDWSIGIFEYRPCTSGIEWPSEGNLEESLMFTRRGK